MLGQAIAKGFIEKGISVLGLSRTNNKNALLEGSEKYKHIACDLSMSQHKIRLILDKLSESRPSAIVYAHRYRSENKNYSLSEHIHVECLMPLFIAEHLSTCSSLSSIIFLTSIASKFVCAEQSYGYHFAKSCIDSMVRKMAFEMAGKKISVNGISLGYVKQPAKEKRTIKYYEMDKIVVPRGGAPTVEEISEVIQSMYSLPPAVVTGQIIGADAGASLLSQPSLANRLFNS